MCGIIGYVGQNDAVDILLEGLKRLEYRGYDSAGIAVYDRARSRLKRVRAEGKIENLIKKVSTVEIPGYIGIGHTRWATHGAPTEKNAHPHKSGPFVLVHNGIVENYATVKQFLLERGEVFESETDTEVIVKLIDYFYRSGFSDDEAIRNALKRIKGTYAVVVFSENLSDSLFCCRMESPLVIGIGENETFVASDIPAILPYTRRVIYLEDGDFAVVRQRELRITDIEGSEQHRPVEFVDWNPVLAEKGGFRHFMQKEIFEQPRALSDTIKPYINFETYSISLPYASFLKEIWKQVHRVFMTACGTSYHAALVGRYMLEQLLEIPVEVDLASEFRYRNPVLDERTLVVAISQSGETADTKGAITLAIDKNVPTCSIVNVVGSSLSRMTDAVIYTHAGPEIGVASTKAFSTQLAALLLFALLGHEVLRPEDREVREELIDELLRLPSRVEEVLRGSNLLEIWARKISSALNALYLGRHVLFPIALEGALKLKEISYIHAEGYAAGEMKHGPIALIDDNLPVVCLVQYGSIGEKMHNNIEEVQARGGRVFIVADERLKERRRYVENVFWIPEIHELLTPLLFVLPLQLLAYHVAVERGTDVDQPRNLAKSVTVE
ncbi:MAG: glutamine--fructose-6-phosphate transaminase (isomerizing) [Deltaproteobacteria bacterium]|nr:glutamine--fructose-6-phosphate transaminase (isomerizing) [Deltaproteobacteria bacterium]MBW2069385.1 glutamine--fructose-6-phosphate transaminase (isomerizing) [Deltaproteobacteria bacterium]